MGDGHQRCYVRRQALMPPLLPALRLAQTERGLGAAPRATAPQPENAASLQYEHVFFGDYSVMMDLELLCCCLYLAGFCSLEPRQRDVNMDSDARQRALAGFWAAARDASNAPGYSWNRLSKPVRQQAHLSALHPPAELRRYTARLLCSLAGSPALQKVPLQPLIASHQHLMKRRRPLLHMRTLIYLEALQSTGSVMPRRLCA